MFRKLRIAILLLILVFVAMGAWFDRARSTDWNGTLWVAVYPIKADSSGAVDAYVGSLSGETFQSIEQFMTREAARYGISLERPVRMELYDRVNRLPPELKPGANVLSRIVWSLRMRYWAWRASSGQSRPQPDIRLFVLYHDPAISSSLPHSLGLQKGLLGVVHAFASDSMTGSNNIVIAHELLHTLGATDKYDLSNGQPKFPDGIADPERSPLYPQDRAEIMAGQRMVGEQQWDMPESLRDVVVGPKTAGEIQWPGGKH